jgi:hypothetical protein
VSDTKLFSTPADALKKVSSEYEYWSGRLTETSLQMCYALIAANWVVFGSVNGILANVWAKASLLMVLLALAANIVGAWLLSEKLRERVEYGEEDGPRWQREFDEFTSTSCPWPFTGLIEKIGRRMRMIKAGFTLVAGALLMIGAILK